MADIVPPEERSRIMSRIGPKDTKIEIDVRKGLFKKGFRYRIHVKKLPGTPDIVLKKYKTIIEVRGCFWHGHKCKNFKYPSSNVESWKKKVKDNKLRDKKNTKILLDSGWRVLVVWGCSIRRKRKEIIEKVLNDIENWILGNESYKEIT